MSKKEKSLHEKVKNFFGRRDTTPINFEGLRVQPFVINSEVLRDISSENDVAHRLRTLKELYEIVISKKLADFVVEAICREIEDLIGQNQSIETRHIVFQFYCALIIGQLDQMFTMRHYLFKLMAVHDIQDDLLPRLHMLKALTQNGRTVAYFEEEIGPFLLHWFPEFMASGQAKEFLSLVTTVIKCHAAYIDEKIIDGYVKYVLKICCSTKSTGDIEQCLNILEAILCYSHVPATVLHPFICSLCLTINIEPFVQKSWTQMRNLLGTNIGHTGIRILCLLIQDLHNYNNSKFLRGAVFFIGMALWGTSSVKTLNHPPTAVLPSFMKVLETKERIIAHEVVIAISRLVDTASDQLVNRSDIWDSLFDIIERVLLLPEASSIVMAPLPQAVHDFINLAEEKCTEDSYESLYRVIELCSDARNEQSVIRLLNYKTEYLKWYRPDFIASFSQVLEKFFKNEKRAIIQLAALRVVSQAREVNARFFEDDSIDLIVLQNVSHSDTIVDSTVRKAVVDLLIVMVDSNSNTVFTDALDILEKILKRTLDRNMETGEESHPDIVAAVEGLIRVFKRKLLFFPSNQCIDIFMSLVKHMNHHYQNLLYHGNLPTVRKLILEFFFQIRADRHNRIGIHSSAGTEYSVYIECDPGVESLESTTLSPPPGSPTMAQPVSYLSFDKAYQIILNCLKEEKDWSILEMIFKEIPVMLQNKTLIIKGNCSLAKLCSTLCSLVNDRNFGFPGSLKNAPQRLTKTDVYSQIFPSIAALTSYHSNLESYMQRMLIRSLQTGLVSRSAKICMEGLTLCTLEMQNSMVKLLPDVLLRLSKISATKIVAVSVLEFLSNLIRLPHLYVSFVEDQYMSIFAIALPYTNPFKFSQYTVALAHHVLSMWFLKCRIPFRRDFAKFITKGLRNNLNVPRDAGSSNENESKFGGMSTAAILALHTELMETGLDLMARFTFGMCTNVPHRSPVSEFLLEKGQKSSWLVGNKIVTITTSGCGTKSFKQGLCEQCYNAAHTMDKSESEDSIFMEDAAQHPPSSRSHERKRHRSAIQRTHTATEKLAMEKKAKDDLALHQQRRHGSLPDSATSRKGSLELDGKGKDKEDPGLCGCWCTSWVEVHIRRPTGSTSFMMQMQNKLFLPSAPPDIPRTTFNCLMLQPNLDRGDGVEMSISENDSASLAESDYGELPCEGAIDITPSQKSKPPMRRTNSSPDLNTGGFKSFEKENTQGVFEEVEETDLSDTRETSSTSSLKKLAFDDKVKAKHLKLDLNSSKEEKHSFESNTQKEGTSSAPTDKRFSYSEVPQHSAAFRDRGHTISVMSPSRPAGSEKSIKDADLNYRNGMSPSFVFLQMFHNSCFGPATHKPLLLLQSETNNRALNVLDHIPPYDTHKIGIIYIGPGQADDEVAILSNVYGSTRYVAFLEGMGEIVHLADTDPHATFLGGLDTRGEDGKLCLIWHDDVMQVVFHVATFMENKESDKKRTDKKRHIANDCVMIAYNDSGREFKMSTVKGQVTNAVVVIQPEDFKSNVVTVQHKTGELVETFGHTESYIVSDASLSIFVRQLALHANLASLIISRKQQSGKYTQVSNWLERLRAIKRLKNKVTEELKSQNEYDALENPSDTADYDDFTDYV